jgi:hypothetical protein
MLMTETTKILLLAIIVGGATLLQADTRLQDNKSIAVVPDKPGVINVNTWKMHLGDSTIYKDPDYSDSNWETIAREGAWFPKAGRTPGIWWYRTIVKIPVSHDTLNNLGIAQSIITSANEVYWDGKLVGANGKIGDDRITEKSGKNGRIFIIPRTLSTSGEHLLALRVSNFHQPLSIIAGSFYIGSVTELFDKLFFEKSSYYFFAGCFGVAGLFYLLFLFGRAKKWPYALFAALCFCIALYNISLDVMHWNNHLNLSDYLQFFSLSDLIWFFMVILLPAFFLYEFMFAYRLRIILPFAIGSLLIWMIPPLIVFRVIPASSIDIYHFWCVIQPLTAFGFSLMVTIWAVCKKKSGSVTALIGVVIFLLGLFVSFFFTVGWGLGFGGLIIILGISLSRQMANRTRTFEQSELRTARLELELLKKHIHPHYLLNTLNSIVAWIEEEPRNAVILIGALADEFRMLLRFSKLPLIPLSEEIALCKSHLRVMGLRYGKEFVFDSEGIEGKEMIPPLVIHTLVENGLTHGYKQKHSGRFILTRKNVHKGYQLSLFNDGTVNNHTSREGSGLHYVKVRLEEAFPGNWQLKSSASADGWITTIELENA